MRQSIDEISGYPQKPTLAQRAIWVIWLLFLISICFAALVFALTMPAGATEINPSVDNQPIQCRYTLTKWLCDTSKPGAMGLQGINGTPGLPGESNFTAIYYNATNFTARSNITYFINSTSFNVTSNYTVFNGASFYNMTAINESYAYLPGRAGGQALEGGTTSGNLMLNGSASNGYIILQPVAGNVGIGTSTPTSTLSFGASTASITSDTSDGSDSKQLTLGGGGTNSNARGGNIILRGNEFSSATAGGVVIQGGTVTTGVRTGSVSITTGGGLTRFSVNSTGEIGIGTTAPTAQLHTTGTVRFANFGAGTATFDSGGNITSVSDSKAKTNIAPYPAGLAQVLQLAPKQYKYSVDSGLDTQNTYVGFIAQDVEKVLPDAVKTKDDVKYEQKLSKKGTTSDEDEYTTVEVKTGTQTKSLDDRAIIAALVNSVKEQQAEINALNERIKKLEDEKT